MAGPNGSEKSGAPLLSDPVTICLQGALQRLRQARALSEGQDDTPEQRLSISTAWVAVRDALDARDES